MRLARPRTSVRLRLALWYTLTLAVALVLYAGLVYALVRRSRFRELDRELHEDLEYAEAMLDAAPDAGVRWRGRSADDALEEPEYALLEVRADDGGLVHREPSSGAQQSAPPAPMRRLGPRSVRMTEDRPVRSVTRPYVLGRAQVWITVARSEEPARAELRRLLVMLTLGVPVASSLAGVGGYLLARRALAPVERIVERASAITAERLSERLPVENPGDELGRLAAVFNAVFERLERSFEKLRRFTADASHELRTPLTALKSVGEVGLREPRGAEEYREIIGSMLEESDRLVHLVDDLLLLSRADAEQVRFSRERVDLSELAREAAGRVDVLAEEKQQSLELEVALAVDGELAVSADRAVLRQAFLNLLDNAIRHSPAGARIRLRAARSPEGAVFEVSDTGPGIAPEHQPRVFDRFYRAEPGRERERGGAGLGLAIARWAVESQGGRIELESELGQGSTFRIVLPEIQEETT